MMERAATIDFAKARARARDVTVAINNEGTPRPTFALLDTLPVPSTGMVDKVYGQLRDILGVAAKQ
jgi:hypothetical protein